MTGTLIYDHNEKRLAVRDGEDVYHLHCGDGIEVQREIVTDTVKTVWLETRVEYADDWFLVGLYKSGDIPYDLTVRI